MNLFQVIDNVQSYNLESRGSVSLVSPCTTPSPSLLGSRKNSMSSISSIASSTSTLGEIRTGTWSSRTSSICASLTDGSPLKQENSLNGEMMHCNGEVTTHQSAQGTIQGSNSNRLMLPSHDSVDFHSLQLQMDTRTPKKESVMCNGIRPGSSQSFTVSTNNRPTSQGTDI